MGWGYVFTESEVLALCSDANDLSAIQSLFIVELYSSD
jgi:hypothetical protein